MKNPENPSWDNNRQEVAGQGPDLSKLSNDELKTYLQGIAAQIRRNIIVTKGYGCIIELVQNKDSFAFRVTDPKTNDTVFLNVDIPGSISSEQHGRLVQEATRLKKAYLIAVAILGKDYPEISDASLVLPDYIPFDNQWLEGHIRELKDDFGSMAKSLLLQWNPQDLDRTSSWLAGQFDEWIKAQSEAYSIGRVCEVEGAIGQLGHRRHMDCPPYAQVILQKYFGAGIRHPEYHLATDLALLYNLFLDAQDLMAKSKRQGNIHSSESFQSLGRNVIQVCFNLLEAFITGLASEFIHESPNASQDTIRLLKGIGPDGKYLNLRLDQKFELFPALITGKPKVDVSQPPFRDLFGIYKSQRNAFAHPSMPLHPEDKHRIQNETRFHDITFDGVRETVNLTFDAINFVWKMVHGKPQPSWLRTRQSDGRFPRVDVRLAQVPDMLPQSGKESADDIGKR